MRRWVDAITDQQPDREHPGLSDLGSPPEKITTVIDTTDLHARREQAMRLLATSTTATVHRHSSRTIQGACPHQTLGTDARSTVGSTIGWAGRPFTETDVSARTSTPPCTFDR